MDAPPLKLAEKLKDKKFSKERGLCLVEGWKCLEEANQVSPPKTVFVEKTRIDHHQLKGLTSKTNVYPVDREIIESLCSTKHPEGVVGIFDRPKLREPQWSNGLHVILYQWQDPSNLGALVRTARGLGVRSVSTWGPSPDFFSPKVIRSSMGSVFKLRLFQLSDFDLEKESHRVYWAEAGAENVREISLNESEVNFLVIGSESHGLPDCKK